MFKNKIVMLTVIIFIGLALIGGTTFAIWKVMYSSEASTDPTKAAEEVVAEETAEPLTIEEISLSTIELEELTTTLKSGNFIKLKIAIQIEDPAQLEAFKKTQFIASDIVMRTLADTNADQIRGNKGIGELASSIMKQLNEAMADTKVVKVYVSSIIIQ